MKALFGLVVSTACILGHFVESKRIVGGEAVNIEDFPYIVQLNIYNSFLCGASIISPMWIISAAHCTDNDRLQYSIRAGTSYNSKDGVLVKVKKVYNHPQFNPSNFDNDFSILGLEKPLKYDFTISQVGLPQLYQEVPEGTIAVVSGWGHLTVGGSESDTLQAVEVPTISNRRCEEMYPLPITDSMLCAGYPEGGKDSCQGDSGGPLVANDVLIGVVSWGISCAYPRLPGVYAKVSQLRDFVTKITGI